MKTTELLSNEHKHILKAIERLKQECNNLENSKKLEKVFLLRGN